MKEKIKIKIKVNGKTLSIEQNSTIVKLIKKLDIPLNKVAIELNKKIIDKKKLKKITLNNKDNLEIVHFIGGG
jgi:thiamine biosynthesis protein ThiS